MGSGSPRRTYLQGSGSSGPDSALEVRFPTGTFGWLSPNQGPQFLQLPKHWNRLSAEELMLSDCGAGEDSSSSSFFFKLVYLFSVQFSSVAQSCLTLCDLMNHSTPGLSVHHQLLEFTQTHVHQVGDAIQPSYPLSSPSPPALNPSEHQSLSQWVSSLHEAAKVLEFQL